MKKKCTQCRKKKNLSEFSPHKYTRDKRASECRECHNILCKEYYKRNQTSIRQKMNSFFKTFEGKQIRDSYNHKYSSKNPEKVKAHQMVASAVRYGKIPKVTDLPCEQCGEPAEHYHHEDYSKPLDIVALCNQCHKDIHRKS